jgi:hypothetical protein
VFTELISAAPSPKNHDETRRLGWLKGKVDNDVEAGSVPADPPCGDVAEPKPPCTSSSHLPDAAPWARAGDAMRANEVTTASAAAHRYDTGMMTSETEGVERD